MSDDKTPACDGEFILFWDLMDSPANHYLADAAAKFCGRCPLRDECLMTPYDDEWLPGAQAVLKSLIRSRRREVAA